MGFWKVFLLVALVALCVYNIVFPRQVWGLFKSWRFRNPDVVEPSDLVLWYNRASSALVMVLIVGLAVHNFLDSRRDDRCEALLPELTKLHATDGIPAVRRRADDLGLEVVDRTYDSVYGRGIRAGSLVITDDGDPFATILAIGSEGHCDT